MNSWLFSTACLQKTGFILYDFKWIFPFFFFFKQSELACYYYLSFFFFFKLTAIVKHNWLKMFGNISKSTYSCLNSVPIEINGIISVVITRSRVKLTPTALQGCLLKMYIVVCNQARCSSENEHPLREFWTMWIKRSWKKSILNA